MTTKVKPKTLSEIRREEALRKISKKQTRLAKRQKKQAQNKPVKTVTGKTNRIESVQKLDQMIKDGKYLKPNMNLTFEERFVKTIEEMDELLSGIGENINKFHRVDVSLNWASFKDTLPQEESERIQKLLDELEEINEKHHKGYCDEVNTLCAELEVLKAAPTPEGLETFNQRASTIAFARFGTWNEDIIHRYLDIYDLIENL